MEGTLAVVTNFAGNFAPKYWAYCQGQILQINTNQALFSLLGTTFGGNGQTTFALPDLRGRAAVSQGTGPGLSPYNLGQQSGQESVTLQISNLPAHNHTVSGTVALQCDSNDGSTDRAALNYPAKFSNAYSPTATGTMAAPTITPTVANAGSGSGFSIRNPYLALNYIICLQGIFPSRN